MDKEELIGNPPIKTNIYIYTYMHIHTYTYIHKYSYTYTMLENIIKMRKEISEHKNLQKELRQEVIYIHIHILISSFLITDLCTTFIYFEDQTKGRGEYANEKRAKIS